MSFCGFSRGVTATPLYVSFIFVSSFNYITCFPGRIRFLSAQFHPLFLAAMTSRVDDIVWLTDDPISGTVLLIIHSCISICIFHEMRATKLTTDDNANSQTWKASCLYCASRATKPRGSNQFELQKGVSFFVTAYTLSFSHIYIICSIYYVIHYAQLGDHFDGATENGYSASRTDP